MNHKLRLLLLWIVGSALFWLLVGLAPDSWKKPAGTILPFFGVGTLGIHKKDKNGKTELQIMTSFTDWVGLTLLILAAASIWKGYDPITVINALKGLISK